MATFLRAPQRRYGFMTHSAQLHQQIVGITQQYIGDAAENFIDRQIEHHLKKAPRTIERQDLPLLINWIRVTVSMIIDERDVIEDYLCQLERLVANRTALYQGRGNPER